MQAVRESYADIGLMRERGLSWAEISDLLAKLGVTARDNQPISPVTLRSAYFLVGNEGREHAAEPGATAGGIAAETLAAVHEAALAARREASDQAEPEDSAKPVDESTDDAAAAAPDGVPAPSLTGEIANEIAANDAAPDTRPEEPPAEAPGTLMAADSDAAPDSRTETAGAAVMAVSPAAPGGKPSGRTAPPNDRPDDDRPAPAAPTERYDAAVDADGATEGPVAELIEAPAPEPVSQPAPTAAAQSTRSLMSHDESTNVHWKGDRMLGTIFVLNDRGGVGKTLLSHHLMATAMLEGLQLKVVEYEVNERLARLFGPDVVEHRRITQDFMNMMGSGDGFYEFWDLIGPELQRGGRLYDFGGNISQWFFNWAEVSGFDYYVGDGERLTFMVPVTVDLASLSTGMTTLERVATIAPKAKRVLVENGFSGPFSQLEDSQYARRKAEMVEREGLQVISMPPCTAPAWARLTGHRLDQVATMTREDLVKLGMTPPVASRSLIIIHEWLRNMRLALSPYLHDAFRQSPAASKSR
nr:hypothetical protein [Azospirillum picis]